MTRMKYSFSDVKFGNVLFSSRKREGERTTREAAGESLWISEFSDSVRVKITYALIDTISDQSLRDLSLEAAHGRLAREYGVISLTGSNNPVSDILQYIRTCPDENIPDVIEAMWQGVLEARNTERGYHFIDPSQLHSKINEILQQERIAFDLGLDQMVDFESRELHDAIVRPVLTLLANQTGWDEVETAYQKALSEIASDPSDSITDAASALQLTLKLRNCAGNALGDLAKSAVSRGVISSYDQKIIDWVSADRGSKGDAHGSPDTPANDAWLCVHVVGALILRLSSEIPR